MKRYITVLTVAILLMFSSKAYSQYDQYTIMSVIGSILEKGIAFDEPLASFTFLDDFFGYDSTSNANDLGWTQTSVGKNTVAITDSLGGIMKISTGAVINDRVNVQWNSEIFKFGQNKDFKFSTRISLADNDSSFWFLGFSVTDTDLEGGATDMFGFLKEDGDSLIYAVNTKNSVGDTTSMSVTMLNNTVYDLSIAFSDSSAFTFNVNQGTTSYNQVRHTTASRMPTDTELAPVIEFSSGDAAATTFIIDWFFFRRVR